MCGPSGRLLTPNRGVNTPRTQKVTLVYWVALWQIGTRFVVARLDPLAPLHVPVSVAAPESTLGDPLRALCRLPRRERSAICARSYSAITPCT